MINNVMSFKSNMKLDVLGGLRSKINTFSFLWYGSIHATFLFGVRVTSTTTLRHFKLATLRTDVFNQR